MGVILDSSILIAAERKRFDLVGFFSAHANETIFITAITASELLYGCERRMIRSFAKGAPGSSKGCCKTTPHYLSR